MEGEEEEGEGAGSAASALPASPKPVPSLPRGPKAKVGKIKYADRLKHL